MRRGIDRLMTAIQLALVVVSGGLAWREAAVRVGSDAQLAPAIVLQ